MENIYADIFIVVMAFMLAKFIIENMLARAKQKQILQKEYLDILNNPEYMIKRKAP